MAGVVAQKDTEIQRLSTLVGQADLRIKQAVHAREEELCTLVMQREEEVRIAMNRREGEILEAVRKREDEINDAWQKREEAMRVELTDAVKWVEIRQKELMEEADRIETARRKLEEETESLQRSTRGRFPLLRSFRVLMISQKLRRRRKRPWKRSRISSRRILVLRNKRQKTTRAPPARPPVQISTERAASILRWR